MYRALYITHITIIFLNAYIVYTIDKPYHMHLVKSAYVNITNRPFTNRNLFRLLLRYNDLFVVKIYYKKPSKDIENACNIMTL